jgi:hypothetical protein
MTTREDLHRLVERLPEGTLEDARQSLAEYVAEGDAVLKSFLTAPLVDEPETEEERNAMAEAYEDLKAGRVVSLEEVKHELGL